jgi:hypothetical protein
MFKTQIYIYDAQADADVLTDVVVRYTTHRDDVGEEPYIEIYDIMFADTHTRIPDDMIDGKMIEQQLEQEIYDYLVDYYKNDY